MNLQTLKKAMLAYVSAVKFIWSELAYPLSIVGKKLMNLRDYRIYGNSIQDGTPTPDSPVEIECVGDLSTKNLFDKDKEKYNVFMDSNTVISKSNYYTIFVNVENISNFTISTKSEKNAYYGLCDSIDVGSEIYEHNYFGAGISRKVINNTHKYVGISIYYTNISELDSVQLEEGTTATDYEPYHKYKIPVVARGKNMATAQQVYSNASNYSECIEDGRNCIRCTSAGTSYAGINFKENTQYTVRFEAKTVIMSAYEEDGNGEALFAFTHTDGTRKLIVVYGSKDWKYYEATSLANKTIASVGMYAYNYKHWIYVNVDTFQIEEGTTATAFEPYIAPVTTNIYLNEPLRKVWNIYSDYIDFEKQKVIRNLKMIYKLIGTPVQYGKVVVIRATSSPLGVGAQDFYSKTSIRCSHIKGGYDASGVIFSNATGRDIQFYLSDCGIDYTSETALDEFKALMGSWNASGKFQMLYALATPIEETVNLPALPQFKGTTIYEVGTSIKPSGMEAKYC